VGEIFFEELLELAVRSVRRLWRRARKSKAPEAADGSEPM
jgi:hypothetical protein